MQTHLATDVQASVFVMTAHATHKTTQADKTVWKGSLAFPSRLGSAGLREHHAFLFWETTICVCPKMCHSSLKRHITVDTRNVCSASKPDPAAHRQQVHSDSTSAIDAWSLGISLPVCSH